MSIRFFLAQHLALVKKKKKKAAVAKALSKKIVNAILVKVAQINYQCTG